jgi:hypothetical protein
MADEEFDIKKIENELSEEVKELVGILEADQAFEAELDIILSAMQESSVNLSYVQAHIMLLIEATFKKLKLKDEEAQEAQNDFNQKKLLITQNLKELSTYLMMQRSNLAAKTMFGIDNPADKNLFINTEIKAHLKIILRRFAIYEIYKIMTPKRIAGKTKRQNFVANCVLRGMKVAMKHEGGSIREIKSYGKDVLKEIKNYKQTIGSKSIRDIGKNIGKDSGKL